MCIVCVCVCVCVFVFARMCADMFAIDMLKLQMEKYSDLSESQAIPTFGKGGILDNSTCEKKSIVTCWEFRLYPQI